MSIRSYIAMVYALVAVMVFGLAAPGGMVHAERQTCADEQHIAAIIGNISGDTAKIEVDENWLGWLMWEPAVYHVPEVADPEVTRLISCGAAQPSGGTAKLEFNIARTEDLRTVTLPVIDTARHPAETYLLEEIADGDDLPTYLTHVHASNGPRQEPLWLSIDTGGHEIEIWSDTHAIDIVAIGITRIITLAPDADLSDPVMVLRYRLTPEAPLLAATTAQGI